MHNKIKTFITTAYTNIKKNIICILVLLLFGVIVYYMLLSQNLVNCYDGLWWNSIYFAHNWERSLGRWLWPYLDVLKFGVISPPLNSVLTLILEAFSIILLADLFEAKNRIVIFLMGALFISSPLTCNVLSYSYMSVTFGMAFFLSVLAAYCTVKITPLPLSICTGSILVACTMGCYQAYLGVTCIIFLLFLINTVLKNLRFKEIFHIMCKETGAVLFGGIAYKSIVTVINNIYGISLSNYKGTNTVSISSIILGFPEALQTTYTDFYKFFYTSYIYKNIWCIKKINICIFILVGSFILYKFILLLKMNRKKALFFVFLIIIIPPACNIVILLVNQSHTSQLMAGAMVLLPSLFLLLFDNSDKKNIFSMLMCFLLFISIWVNIYIVNNDQLAMREGRISTITISQNILTKIISEGYIDDETEIALVGRPSDNMLFKKMEAWKQANDYARFGRWWVKADCNRMSWKGIFNAYCGIELKFCNDTIYNEIINNTVVEEMNTFPHKDCIKTINNILVIKVSDFYK